MNFYNIKGPIVRACKHFSEQKESKDFSTVRLVSWAHGLGCINKGAELEDGRLRNLHRERFFIFGRNICHKYVLGNGRTMVPGDLTHLHMGCVSKV